jgi:outer membrane protein OmpA-like peptidoglycan-associated protein
VRAVRAVRAGCAGRIASIASIASIAGLTSSLLAPSARADDAGAGAAVRTGAAGPLERRLQVSGFVGYSTFGDTELGNSWAPDQAPGTSAVIGARVGWLAVPDLVRRGRLALSLVVEAELAFAAAFTGGSSFDDERGRMSYFAPVFGWRAHALLRQPAGAGGALALHAVLGAGGATVTSSSPFMLDETDPLGYAGLGATYAVSDRLQLRVDGRQGIMPGRSSSATRVSELHLGLSATFGAAAARRAPAVLPPDAPDELVVTDAPDEPAAPALASAPDPDGDGVAGAADACPLEAEDLDGFEDEDGCPDPDNDGDGIEDARDACPGEPETLNGIADADGCPDVVPDTVTRALAGAAAVRFERNRARVTPAAKRALQPVLAVLEAHRDLALVVTGLPERAVDHDLAKRRAEAVKWHLVDLGIAEDRLETAVGPIGAKGSPPILLRLRQSPPPPLVPPPSSNSSPGP